MSLTDTIVMVKVLGALVFEPPLAVPPSSTAVTVTVARPWAFAAEVNVSVPLGLIAGWTANSAGVSAMTVNVTFWADSLAGPGEIAVTQPLTE